MRLPTHRPPTHPGEMLALEFLKPLKVSQHRLAEEIGVTYRCVHDLVHGRGMITPSLALRFSKFLGTTPEFWLNLQRQWDLWHALRADEAALRRIRPLRSSASAA